MPLVTTDDGELSKVFVEGNDDLLMLRGVRENRGVAGIGGPTADVVGFVARFAQGGRR